MRFNKIKTTGIVLLIIIALYQTMILWIAISSGDSPFSMLARNINNTNMQKKLTDSINNIFINTGDAKFIKKNSRTNDIGYRRVIDESIGYSLKYGKIRRVNNFKIEDILNRKGIIYAYAYDISGEDITALFNIKGDITKIKKFNNIAIFPLEKGAGIEIIFFDKNTLNAYSSTINKPTFGENINNIINEIIRNKGESMYYAFTLEDTKKVTKNNKFLPISDDNTMIVNDIEAINPLEKGGGILLSESAEYIDVFFPNPAIKTSTFINDTYTYNDDNIVVKYYTNGVLEYVNYSSVSNLDNISPYDIAKKFLVADINIKNEYYLKQYIIEKDKTIFKFDYKLDGIPIKLSDSQKRYTDLDSMIEITVEKGRVSKYKRLIYNFYIKDTILDINIDYDGIIQSFLDKNNKNTVDNISLVYKFDRINEPIQIGFNLYDGGNIYFEKALFKEVIDGY